ncbi:MAG: hypothetical protein JKX94_07590 [Sneathiella sp.]|nr:hypothetical protein [Sneathiella sp.]
MAKSDNKTVDMLALVTSHISGNKGFANSKRIKRMGIEEYSQWLSGKLAEQAAFQMGDPRRQKRVNRIKKK